MATDQQQIRPTGVDGDVDRALDAAASLAAEGRILEAIDHLDEVDRTVRDPRLERELVRLRFEAFRPLRTRAAPTPWPEVEPYDAPRHHGLPMIPMAELTAQRLRGGILGHGCVMVPGLVPRDRCERLIADIDRGFAALADHADETRRTRDGWYEPFDPPGLEQSEPPLGIQRHRAGKAGSLWTVDSPRLLQEVCVLTEEVGLRRLIEDYIGERPVMSATKSNLRRVPIDAFYADWHQDGAFLGQGIRTINVWITLSDCGVDAPGLDILPMRVDHVVETGTEGAIFGWAASPAKVAEVGGATPIVRPEFAAGDALLFDELFLHRTACTPEMTRERYALENWYFAPSDYPDAQIPFVY